MALVHAAPPHPRIWLLPDTLARLKAAAAANDPNWKLLKSDCDEFLTSDSLSDTSAQNYALAWQVAGDTRYADKAISIMQRLVDRGTDGITGDSYYYTRTVLPSMAVGWDWCYARLSAAQRTAFRAQMEAWADAVWPETNPARAGAWGVNKPGSNYFHGFMMTWMIGLALLGESAKAQGYVDLAKSKWNSIVVPYLAQYGAGGYLLEGTNYGPDILEFIFSYLTAHRTATGEDFLNVPPGNFWAREALLAKLYLATPDYTHKAPWGDQSSNSHAPMAQADRASALIAMNYLDSTTAGMMRSYLDRIVLSRSAWRFADWQELLWYRPDVAPIDYTQTLPTGYQAVGAGWMAAMSGWGAHDTQLQMMCGPLIESHQDFAANAFMIYRDGWLTVPARYASASGLYPSTQFHNDVTVDGNGQEEEQTTAHILMFQDAADQAYMAAEAGQTYDTVDTTPRRDPLDEFRREVLWIKPDIFIVLDRLTGKQPSEEMWHLQVANQPTVAGATFRAPCGKWDLAGTTLLPPQALVTSEALMLGDNGALSSYRINVRGPRPAAQDWFLHVLQIVPAMQAAPPVSYFFNNGTLAVGPYTVGVDLTGQTSPLLKLLGTLPPPVLPNTVTVTLSQAQADWLAGVAAATGMGQADVVLSAVEALRNTRLGK